MNTEPVVTIGSIMAAIGAILAVIVGFDIAPMSPDQQALLMGAAAAILPLVAAFWSRGKVTPVNDPKAENTRGQLVELVPADGSTIKK